MKKTSINILCILVIIILASSVLIPACYLGSIFYAGLKDGYAHAQAIENGSIEETEFYDPTATTPVDVYFSPDVKTMVTGSETLRFASGEEYKLALVHGSLIVPSDKWPSSYSWGVFGIYSVCVVLFIFLIIEFIKFIININKGRIFEKKNVMRLRRFAWCLISISILKCVAGIIEDYMISTLNLSLENYSLSAYWQIPWDLLLLGLLALLMAQVWSYGLQLKQEQELTI